MTEMDSENNKKESKRKKLAPDSGSRGIYIPLSEFTNLSLITNHKDTNIQQKNTKPKEEKRLVLIDGEPTFQNQDNDQNLSGKTSQVVQHDNEINNAALVFEILNKETIDGPAVQSTYRLDHKWCQKAKDDTNLLSNIAPQHEDLNQEKLKDLEELCRLYVQGDYSKAYIYTGPLYHTKKDITKEEKRKIEERSKNAKALPTYFFKIIILEKDNGERELKCYEIPNEGKGQGQEKQQQKQQETHQQQNQQEKLQNQQQKQQQKLQQKQEKQQEKHQKQEKQQEKHQKQEKQHQNQQETQQQKNQQQKQQQKLQEKLQQKQEKQQQKLQQKLQQKQEKQQQKLQQKQEKQREKQKQLQLQQQQKLQQKQEKEKEKLQQEQQKQQEKLQEKQEKEQQKLQQKLQQKQEKQQQKLQQKLQQKQEKEQEKQRQKLQQKHEKEQQKEEKEQEKEHEKQQEKLQQKQQEKPQHQKKVTIKDIENELSTFSRDIHYIEEVSGLTFTEKNQEILRKREEVMAVNFREDNKDTTSNPTHKLVETVKIIPKQNTFQSEV